jgi:hypothetical protein
LGPELRRALIVVAVTGATIGISLYMFYAPVPLEERWFLLGWLLWAVVGAAILWKRPGNGVAHALLWTGLLWGLSAWSTLFSASDASLEARVWSDLIGVITGVLPWLGIIWLILVFPGGRLEGRLEKLVGGFLAGFSVLAIFSFLVSTTSMEGPTGQSSPLATPVFDDTFVSWLVSEDGFSIVLVLALLAVFSLARRWVSSSGVERHQYRWLLFGTMLFVAILAISQVVPEWYGDDVLWTLACSAIPICVGIAVTRYRLYEIDRIISRTVSYALVVAVLVGAVAALAALIGAQFQEPWVVAATTLGVAALFTPLRRRSQTWVDRRFNRSHYDAERVMDGFAASLRSQVIPDEVTGDWLAVVNETMQPASAGVWVRK